jgi:hypothetical protein
LSILLDHEGYRQQQSLVELCMLTLAARESGMQTFEGYASLYDCQIGNARRRELLAMSYSTTGGIFRAALNDLRQRGMLTDNFGQPPPYVTYTTELGYRYLQTLNPVKTEMPQPL